MQLGLHSLVALISHHEPSEFINGLPEAIVLHIRINMHQLVTFVAPRLLFGRLH